VDKKELVLELGDEMEAMSWNQLLRHLLFRPSKVIIDGKVVPREFSVVQLPFGYRTAFVQNCASDNSGRWCFANPIVSGRSRATSLTQPSTIIDLSRPPRLACF
jgi:hypothetical protein